MSQYLKLMQRNATFTVALNQSVGVAGLAPPDWLAVCRYLHGWCSSSSFPRNGQQLTA
jgi:hypothetical protein